MEYGQKTCPYVGEVLKYVYQCECYNVDPIKGPCGHRWESEEQPISCPECGSVRIGCSRVRKIEE